LFNKLAGEIVMSWRGAGRRAGGARIAEELQELRRVADAVAATGAGFWELALAGDVLLLEALWRRRLDAKAVERIADLYRRAVLRGASAKETLSVIEQLRFFEAMLETEAPGPVREALEPWLRQLRESSDATPA
jgi:hypothetical protein